jgi:rhamnose transport system permease protein
LALSASVQDDMPLGPFPLPPRSWLDRWSPNGEWVVLAALVAEIAIFAVIGNNFFTTGNFFEVIRLSVELGLLAAALTPVIITGGIDLSVGSMMGLTAVVFMPFPVTETCRPPVPPVLRLVGCTGGSLNALLISRFGLPPLIVTLGSYSMFRGIAEGITEGAVNYSDFPPSFLFVGQGYLWGVVPAQLPIFAAVVAGFYVLLHRSVAGRALYAIGFSPEGARYAGIAVRRHILPSTCFPVWQRVAGIL